MAFLFQTAAACTEADLALTIVADVKKMVAQVFVYCRCTAWLICRPADDANTGGAKS